MEHAYLFKPGLWSLEGRYYDDEERPHRQTGQLLVVHSPDLWTIDGQVRISGDDPREFLSRYEVTPPKPGTSLAEWKSETGGPEPVFGLFLAVEDTIMAPWQSRTGAYWGQEALRMRSPEEYECRGFAFLKDRRVASWAVRMAKQGGGAGEESPEVPS